MYKFLLLFIFSFTLLADNPKVYESLGDIIYDDLSKIQSLKKFKQYELFIDKIDQYSADVEQAKQFGFELQSGKKSNMKLEYLKELRKLNEVNDYFHRTAKSSLKSAIDTNDNTLFIGIVNSGLIDTRKNKNKIMKYYNRNKEGINPDGVIQDFIDEDYEKKHRKRYKPKTKKQIQLEKLKRIRANDELKQKALENKLSQEANAKKEKIRQEQERELFN